MKISQQAWHYRYLVLLQANIPDNLCAYFWTVAFATIVLPPLVLMMALPVVVVGGLVFLCRLFVMGQERRSGRPPTLVVAWLRAKKAKLCPLIEWVKD